mmetsp:Transcript_21379/g.46371  ORF Transcript_21379/g.46371 Transcript_21379/m.46371 type:complete len:211 (-) Transcript_21379:189-821(-)
MKIFSYGKNALFSVFLFAACTVVLSQDYDQGYDQGYDGADQDYYQEEQYYAQEGDNLYHDYAQKHQGNAPAGRGGMFKTAAFGLTTWFLGGKIHSKRAVKKANQAHTKAQKELYLKYLQDVGALQTQNAELHQYIKAMTKQQLNEEFLQADLDIDGKVSRAEFEAYKRQYLQKHPDMVNNFPRFEEFDPDHNGMITVAEHESYYERQGLL